MKWMIQVITQELRRIFTYRADFWIQFLVSTASQVGVAYFLWKAVYFAMGSKQVGPYAFPQMLFYFTLIPQMDNLVRGEEDYGLSKEIYEGTLSRYLVYPVNFFLYQWCLRLGQIGVFLIRFCLAVFLYRLTFGFPEGFVMVPSRVFAVMGFVLLAAGLDFIISCTIQMATFWADQVWSLMVMYRFVLRFLGGATVPLFMFPGWAETVAWKLPFAYFLAFPVKILLGEVPSSQYLGAASILIFWYAAILPIFYWVWTRGLRSYSGVGM